MGARGRAHGLAWVFMDGLEQEELELSFETCVQIGQVTKMGGILATARETQNPGKMK